MSAWTEDEALTYYRRLKQQVGDDDPESFHAQEDAMMCRALKAAGWKRLAREIAEYDGIRWYS